MAAAAAAVVVMLEEEMVVVLELLHVVYNDLFPLSASFYPIIFVMHPYRSAHILQAAQ